jgi:predicted GNAT family acetyltransferase
MIDLQLSLLTSESEARFWDIVKKDYCDYYFFIYDWLLVKERTQISLALEGDEVVGLMLIYEGSIVQLRGDYTSVRFMLDSLKLDKADVQVPLSCESALLEKYPNYKLKTKVNLLSLKKGKESLSFKVPSERLSFEDAQQIALLMNECYPEMWGGITSDNIRTLMSSSPETVWLGIKHEDKLVSFGYATLTPEVNHVTWIATGPEHENKGYATSIVSALVKECLAVAGTTIIYVMEDNTPANRVYSKVGFRPYKSYFFEKI